MLLYTYTAYLSYSRPQWVNGAVWYP
jgi:hypothetical protein